MKLQRHLPFLLFYVLLAPLTPLRADEPKDKYPPPARVREAFLKMLDRPRVLFNVKNDETKKDEDNGLIIERLSGAERPRLPGSGW